MPLTPADVRNKQFSTTRLRPGYDEEEVDAFLDAVEAQLEQLIQENEELRSKLAEARRAGGKPALALSSPLSDPRPDMMAPAPAPVAGDYQQTRRAPATGPAAGRNEDFGAAARVLSLAQQTADRAITDARHEADETLQRARREADDVLTKARRQAEQITNEARARAQSLEEDAREQYRQATGALVQQREELERRVDDLRAFEDGYRSRLKEHLQGQLRVLVTSGPDDELPSVPAAPDPGLPRSPASARW